ncbi:MAG TPA: thiosulfate oxidation carrier complex protein SoxZ [Methylomirabilota bacterium]|nr:thiosulfate oxidation carrier complex protein SoxZ [Methylomirabilota bacterium]
MANARIQAPAEAKRGDIMEIRLLIRHPMETGFRYDNRGKPIPQNVIKHITCRYNNVEVFRAELFPGVAANPYLSFFTVAEASGELEFVWTDEAGVTETERVTVRVVG